MDKVLITGGLGFIGLRVAELLKGQGFGVRLFDNLSAQIHGAIPSIPAHLRDTFADVVRGDVKSRRNLLAALNGVSVVIHLAAETGTAQSMYEIERYTSTNIGGTAMLLDILSNQKHSVRKLVLASSRSVYGEGSYLCDACGVVCPKTRTEPQLRGSMWDPVCPQCGGAIVCIATAENAVTAPCSVYAATKLAQEDLVRIAGQALGIPTVILRLQNVYGEGQSLSNPYTGILSIFSNRMRQNLPISLFEDGRESRDFVNIRDVAQAFTLAVTRSGGDGKTLNVGSGNPTSVAAVADLLSKQFRVDVEISISGQYRIGDIRHCYADLTLARTALGFAPKVPLEEGVEAFAGWVEKQPIERDRLDHANRQLIDRGLMA